jgi:hypothetical protein
MSIEIKKREQPRERDAEPSSPAVARQEQTDPQKTELRGFTDPAEDLEPTLTDGTKAPDEPYEEVDRSNKEDK